MSENQLYGILLLCSLGFSLITFPVLWLITAPYGRHKQTGWGPAINGTLGWLIMESPAVWVFWLCFLLGGRTRQAAPIVFLIMWQAHYIHRALIFPFRRRAGSKPIPALVVLLGFTFNVLNGYLNARYLNTLSPEYPLSWLLGWRFLLGATLFFTGLAINLHADRVLLGLRRPGDTGYKVPHGGLYEWVSCPNYFGEVLEWTGWALSTWSLAGLSFALATAANLVPRARSHHRWYKDTFPNYPRHRKAIFPFLF